LFQKADFGALVVFLNEQFRASVYSLATLFRDEQRKVVQRIVAERMSELDTQLRHLFENDAPLARFLVDHSLPVPRQVQSVAEAVLNSELRIALNASDPDIDRAQRFWRAAVAWPGFHLDTEQISFMLDETMHALMERFNADSSDTELLKRCAALAEFIRETSLWVSLAESQNIFDHVRHTARSEFHAKAGQGDVAAREWCEQFDLLGDRLRFKTA